MSVMSRHLPVALLATALLGFQPSAAQKGEGVGTIRGRVTTADTGQPLQRVEVRACCLEGEDPSTTTDQTGAYELANVPAGRRYTIRAWKTGFLATDYGEDEVGSKAKEIEVREGVVTAGIDIHLPRGGAIEGRVVDQFGEPAPRVEIRAMIRVDESERLYPVASTRPRVTDDRGRFRLFGLPPATYCIALRATRTSSTGPRDIYYPGVPDPAGARSITLGVGEEVRGVDFVLPGDVETIR